jgi:hypothetical protein
LQALADLEVYLFFAGNQVRLFPHEVILGGLGVLPLNQHFGLRLLKSGADRVAFLRDPEFFGLSGVELLRDLEIFLVFRVSDASFRGFQLFVFRLFGACEVD